MSVTFRDARKSDLPVLIELLADDVLGRTREVVADPPAPAYAEALEKVLENPHDAIIVAERDGVVVGCAQLTILHGLSRQGAKRGLIESVRIASAARGGGLGAALIGEVMERARAAGCAMVQLTTDASRKRAHAFYERLGFRATHVGMKREF